MRCYVLCLCLLLSFSSVASAEDKPASPAAPDEAARAATIQMVDELRSVAAEIRGLPWKEKVPADLLTREQLRANLKKLVEEDLKPEEIERDTRIMRRMGLLTADEDPLQMMLEFFEAGVAGYYNPKTKRLYMIAGPEGDAQKPTILHELIHALEDQHIDLLKRSKAIEDDPDRTFAEKIIVEGSAEMARLIYEKRNPEVATKALQARAQPTDKEAGAKQAKALATVPAFLILGTVLHYRTGPNFVSHVIGEEDYAEKMSSLYEDSPTTQEQVLHPARWMAGTRDLPRTIEWGGDFAAAAGEGWQKMHEGPIGELDFALYLDYFIGDDRGRLSQRDMALGNYVSEESAIAATGWDGGRAVYIEKKDQIGILEALVFDSVDDAKEAYGALQKSLAKANADSWKTEAIDHGFGSPSEGAALDYMGKHGAGRMRLRGAEILMADGFTPEELTRVWPCLLKTTFTADPNDKGDETARTDPFVGCVFVDRDRGLGIKAPESWRVAAPPEQAKAQVPMMVCLLQKGSTNLMVMAVDQGTSEGALPFNFQLFGIPKGAAPIKKTEIAGMPAFTTDHMGQTFYVGSDGVRTLVVRRMGAVPSSEDQAEIEQILKDIKSVLGY